MKRLLALTLATSMVWCTACGSTESGKGASSEQDSTMPNVVVSTEAPKEETTTAATTTAEETTTTTTTTTTAETTTTTTTAPEPIEDDTPKDRNGFDYAKGKKFKNAGLTYTLPTYYEAGKDNKNLFGVSETETGGAALIFIAGYSNDSSEPVNDEAVKTFVTNNLSNDKNTIDILEYNNTEICGFKSVICEYNLTDDSNNVFLGKGILIDNSKYKTVNGIIYFQKADSKADYDPDFERMLDNIKIDEDYAPTASASKSDSSTKKEEKNEQKKQEQSIQSPIKATNFYISKDYSGKSVLVVEYQWTNYADYEAYFSLLFNDTVYQNGVECKTAYFCDDVDSSALLTSVQPGASYSVKQAYVLNDSSPVNLVVKPLISFTGEKFIDTTINLS